MKKKQILKLETMLMMNCWPVSSVGDQCAGAGCGCCEGDRGCGAEDVDTGGDQQSDAVATDAQSMSSRRSAVARLSPRSGQESVVDCRRPLRFRRLVCCRRCRYLRREGFVFVSVSLFVSRITEKKPLNRFHEIRWKGGAWIITAKFFFRLLRFCW